MKASLVGIMRELCYYLSVEKNEGGRPSCIQLSARTTLYSGFNGSSFQIYPVLNNEAVPVLWST